MANLTGKFHDSYKSVRKDPKTGKAILDENGRKILTTKFIYFVEGEDEDVQRYLDIKAGEGYDMFDQTLSKVLFFSNQFHGNDIALKITTNDNIVVDTSEMDRVKSFVEANGGNWGQVVTQKALAELNFGNIFGAPAKKSVTKPQPKIEEQVPAEDNGSEADLEN